MTKKEPIMIGGVDVSECVHYEDLSCTAFRDSCGYPLDCKHFFFCNYKQLARKTQECESLKEEIEILKDNFDTVTRDCNELIEELKQECEELKKQLMQKSEVDMFFNTPIEGWSNDPCEICPHKAENEELKKANQHIDANRQCKGSKLKRIEELISACEAGYTDEFIQKIYGIIQESEPAIDDYSIIDRYRKVLEEIEKYCNNVLSFTAVRTTESDILDIINKAKGGGECQ